MVSVDLKIYIGSVRVNASKHVFNQMSFSKSKYTLNDQAKYRMSTWVQYFHSLCSG